MSSKRVTLICPSLNQTIPSHLIFPSETYEHNLQRICAAFGSLRSAWPWDTQGRWLDNFANVKDSQEILVATHYFEDIQPRLELKVTMYPIDDDWRRMDPSQKQKHMAALHKRDKTSNRLVLYLTMRKYIAVATLKHLMKRHALYTPCVNMCYEEMLENWGMKFDAMWAVPGRSVVPKSPEKDWDPRLLPMLHLLSKMTMGQALTARRAVVEKVTKRTGTEMKVKDVERVILDWYEKVK